MTSNLISTRFTRRFNVDHPVMLAPMDSVAGGKLAAAVSSAGGLGVIGGGYGNAEWLAKAFRDAGNQRVGAGFITWSALQQPAAIELALANEPELLMVSFGDAEDIIAQAQEMSIPTAWQVQTLQQARQALRCKVDVIVVQGQEAGGHGMQRGLMSLLPAVRDLCGENQIVMAAGGIADGRGLASAIMLGADGVMMGTRFWASSEASGSMKARELIAATGGDETIRTSVFDVARDVDWPAHYTGRVRRNGFTDQWHQNISGLREAADDERRHYANSDEDDYNKRVLIAGEAADLIDAVEPAAIIVDNTVREAARLLKSASSYCVS